MSPENNNLNETRNFWDSVATDWDIQVGDEGDSNRILNSDPVLWRFVGDVSGRDVLDAGCGTGYLSRKLRQRGAHVIGIDFSDEMIRVASSKQGDIDFRVDSCTRLQTVPDESVDLVVSNYVLMDTPDLESTVESFYRVLRPGGTAVAVFSHPCFPQGRARREDSDRTTIFRWDDSYFERRKYIDPPWKHFKSEFIWFHRPLSDYWKAFVGAGFDVVDFDEPRITEDRHHLVDSEKQLISCTMRAYSVAFKLLRRGLA